MPLPDECWEGVEPDDHNWKIPPWAKPAPPPPHQKPAEPPHPKLNFPALSPEANAWLASLGGCLVDQNAAGNQEPKPFSWGKAAEAYANLKKQFQAQPPHEEQMPADTLQHWAYYKPVAFRVDDWGHQPEPLNPAQCDVTSVVYDGEQFSYALRRDIPGFRIVELNEVVKDGDFWLSNDDNSLPSKRPDDRDCVASTRIGRILAVTMAGGERKLHLKSTLYRQLKKQDLRPRKIPMDENYSRPLPLP